MDKITLSELIPKISELSGGHTRADVRTILDATAEAIKCYAKKGQAVSIPGLGRFYPATRAARTCRNLQTGLPVSVPAKRSLAFKPGSETKDLDK